MNRPALLALTALAGGLPLGLLAANYGPGAVPTAAPIRSPVPPDLAPTSKTAEVVDAANAFLALLAEPQRSVAQIDLTPRLSARWSNFPGGSNLRNGLFFRELDEAQVAAAMKVARLALSEEGFRRFQEIRAADELLGQVQNGPGGRGPGRRGPGGAGEPGPGGPGGPSGPGGPPPGGGMFEQADADKDGKLGRDEAPGFLRDRFDQVDADKDGFISRDEDTAFLRRGGPGGPGGPGGMFGGPGGGYSAANYMIAFLGKPSATTPWLLQLGGHHLAFNIYYKGATGAATPYFLAVEPTTWKGDDGKTYGPLAPMRDAMVGLVQSLTPEQSARARLGSRFSDIYVGPGRDGKFPATSEGVPVGELADASRALVERAIAAWTADFPQADDYRRLYRAELDRTKVAFSGSTNLDSRGDYVRIDGPHVWIEFSCQNGIVIRDQIHYHTIWRDRATDYGAESTF